MREIWKYSLLLASSVLLQCTDKSKTFLVYEVNPLKDAYAENKVQSYIVYGFSEGRRFTGDSVTLDNSGNIERIISTGIKSERRFTYDSLNRRVHECQHSDIHMDIWTTYDDRPEKQMVIKYISNDGDDDGPGEFNHKETLIFDSSLRQLLKEVEVNLSTRDSTATVFDYDGDKLIRSTRSFNGAGGFHAECGNAGCDGVQVQRYIPIKMRGQ